MTINRFTLCLIAALFLNIRTSNAQSSPLPPLPTVTPMTPNAASLFKVLEKPEGSFTGTVPINFPLFTISSGDIKVPATLNYSNGGIRVEEMASSVGLGFSLAIGGQISRSINGVPDDSMGPALGMFSSSIKPSEFPGQGPLGVRLGNAHEAYSQRLDAEPDSYYFNCNGLSGKFFFDEAKQVHLVSQQPIKIQPIFSTSGEFTSWIITDEMGNRYYFGKYQDGSGNFISGIFTSTLNEITGQVRPSPNPCTTTWYLAEIRDMNDEQVVKFTYQNYTFTNGSRSGSRLALSPPMGLNCNLDDYQGEELGIISQCSEMLATSIVGRQDSLVIFSSANRQDGGGGRIDSMSLFSRSGELAKRYHFHYSYFTQPYKPDNAIYKRLKLLSFAELGKASSDSLKTAFDYEENINLPPRSSRGIDYWGYYNGQEGNWTYLPNGNYQDFGTYYRRDDLADRRARPAFAIANTLLKISYPTGGYRQFLYEGNQILSDPINQIQPDPEYYHHQEFSEIGLQFENPESPVITKYFTINSTEDLVNFNIFSSNFYSEVRISRMYNGQPNIIASLSQQFSYNYPLENGNYCIQVYGSYTNTSTIELSCFWDEQSFNINQQNNIAAGGLRTKQINDYDPISGKTYSTSYKYNQFSDSLLTSGVMPGIIRFSHRSSCEFRGCDYICLSAQSNYPLINESGSYVVYPNVTTIEDGNGRNERQYTFLPDGDGGYPDINLMPITPMTDNSNGRGKIAEERWYDQQNHLIKQTNTNGISWGYVGSFLPNYQSMVNSQRGNKILLHYDIATEPNMPSSGCWRPYFVESAFYGLSEVSEKTFSELDNSIVERTSYEYYLHSDMPLLREQKVFLNNGSIKTTTYRYAFNSTGDFVFGLTGNEPLIKEQLLLRHYLKPLEITTYLTDLSGTNHVLVEGSKFIFDSFNGNKLHLSRYQTYGTNGESKETIFSAYDNNGNLTEKYQKNGSREVYLWGYNGSYPVAKIIGSSLTSVMPFINFSILNNPSSDNTLRIHLSAIRNSLPNTAPMSGFTYRPLFGISSASDPRGRNTFYEYDNFMRLKIVKDHDQSLIKSYQYNYQRP